MWAVNARHRPPATTGQLTSMAYSKATEGKRSQTAVNVDHRTGEPIGPANMPASKAQRAKTAERRAKAVAMRLAGVDYETIAQRLGYASRGAAYTDIDRALQARLVEQHQGADVLRQQELARLDRLQAAAWTAAASGDLKAIDTVLKVVERRCKLLGLDAPTRVDATVTETTQQDLELQAMLREAKARQAAQEARIKGQAQ